MSCRCSPASPGAAGGGEHRKKKERQSASSVINVRGGHPGRTHDVEVVMAIRRVASAPRLRSPERLSVLFRGGRSHKVLGLASEKKGGRVRTAAPDYAASPHLLPALQRGEGGAPSLGKGTRRNRRCSQDRAANHLFLSLMVSRRSHSSGRARHSWENSFFSWEISFFRETSFF